MSIRPHPKVVFRRVGDEIVLVHLATNQIYSLNATSARCWELLSEGRTPDEIARQLQREFDVGDEEVHDEVRELLERLRSAELIVEEPADG
jgi:hypothetical protein